MSLLSLLLKRFIAVVHLIYFLHLNVKYYCVIIRDAPIDQPEIDIGR